MSKIPFSKIKKVKDLYYRKLFSMKKVAKELGVSMDALVYFMRKFDLKRRSVSENEKIKFENKPLTFTKNKINNEYLKELAAIGCMLYWAEGYKGSLSNGTVDFANSDPLMITIFLNYFRKIYSPKEEKIRIYIYCYSDQNVQKLINFWHKITRVPKKQFLKPYIRTDFKKDGRKMKYGMIHVRYYDKKLLQDIKKMIESCVSKYAPIV